MAGRGYGSGYGRGYSNNMVFLLKTLGVPLDILSSPPILQARPLYPHVPTMPVPDTNYSADSRKLTDIALRVKSRWRSRAALMTVEDKKKDIERYSDKFQMSQQKVSDFARDWSQFPAELRNNSQRKWKAKWARPNLKAARKSTPLDTKTTLTKVKESLEREAKNDTSKEEEEEKIEEDDDDEEKDEDEEGEKEEEEEQLEEEEETDYNLTYFDNGEGYGDDDVEDDEPASNFG